MNLVTQYTRYNTTVGIFSDNESDRNHVDENGTTSCGCRHNAPSDSSPSSTGWVKITGRQRDVNCRNYLRVLAKRS